MDSCGRFRCAHYVNGSILSSSKFPEDPFSCFNGIPLTDSQTALGTVLAGGNKTKAKVLKWAEVVTLQRHRRLQCNPSSEFIHKDEFHPLISSWRVNLERHSSVTSLKIKTRWDVVMSKHTSLGFVKTLYLTEFGSLPVTQVLISLRSLSCLSWKI